MDFDITFYESINNQTSMYVSYHNLKALYLAFHPYFTTNNTVLFHKLCPNYVLAGFYLL
jgi:hypothetical protein